MCTHQCVFASQQQLDLLIWARTRHKWDSSDYETKQWPMHRLTSRHRHTWPCLKASGRSSTNTTTDERRSSRHLETSPRQARRCAVPFPLRCCHRRTDRMIEFSRCRGEMLGSPEHTRAQPLTQDPQPGRAGACVRRQEQRSILEDD